jgi:hypothetical protein
VRQSEEASVALYSGSQLRDPGRGRRRRSSSSFALVGRAGRDRTSCADRLRDRPVRAGRWRAESPRGTGSTCPPR